LATDVVVPSSKNAPVRRERYDAIIVGAGITGLYQLHRLRQLNLSVRLLEAGDGVGGTWYWNRYPGARFDSESYTYGYMFSKELQEEWSWSEEFAGQPEVERYLNFVADRLQLRGDIELGTRVAAAHFDEDSNSWSVETEHGRTLTATYFITAVGILSAPFTPPIPEIESFDGECFHTGLWPDKHVDLVGKRVAVVGTGSSGVQIVPIIAEQAASLTVFQRTPNWCTPLNNHPISPEQARVIRKHYREIHRTCMATPTGFKHTMRPESALSVSPEVREAYFEQINGEPGMTMIFKNFCDISTDQSANDLVTDFLARKIKQRVHDPRVADMLIPKDHGYGFKRPPQENGYYEAFNRDNVELVSLFDEPIERFVPEGIQTATRTIALDLIILATGFDAVTGTILRMDIRGKGGRRLKDQWADGPHTYLGIFAERFPNLFIIGGPQSSLGNNPRLTEVQVDWVAHCLSLMKARGDNRIEATSEAVDEWFEHVEDGASKLLNKDAKAWAYGSNIPGKKRAYLLYANGLPTYASFLSEVEKDGYRGLSLSWHPGRETLDDDASLSARSAGSGVPI